MIPHEAVTSKLSETLLLFVEENTLLDESFAGEKSIILFIAKNHHFTLHPLVDGLRRRMHRSRYENHPIIVTYDLNFYFIEMEFAELLQT